jgi:hypothetical protein
MEFVILVYENNNEIGMALSKAINKICKNIY